MSALIGIILTVVIAAIIAGFAVSTRITEKTGAKIILGILFGLGFIAALCGIAFAGCIFVLYQH